MLFRLQVASQFSRKMMKLASYTAAQRRSRKCDKVHKFKMGSHIIAIENVDKKRWVDDGMSLHDIIFEFLGRRFNKKGDVQVHLILY